MKAGGDSLLAPYAVQWSDHGGRVHPEPDDPLRDPFALDRHRIIESTAFRRLEGKTQVFAPAHHDHFRTRLTHTLEVSVIARTLARNLRANETLAEAITLAHDLGHPPFGHAGEAALAQLMADYGGFNHNAHSVRVVEYLEHPFPPFRGLNLTRATLAGLRAHATRYDLPETTEPQAQDGSYISVEAQIASVADRIAYDCHDLEDAIGAGFVSLDSLSQLSLWSAAFDRVAAGYTDYSIHAVRRLVLDAMLDAILRDVIDNSLARLANIEPPNSPDEAAITPSAQAHDKDSCHSPLRHQHPASDSECLWHRHPAGDSPSVWHRIPGETQSLSPSPQMEEMLGQLETFLLDHVYRHPEVQQTDQQGQAMIHALFAAYLADPACLPDRFARRINEQGPHRVICDYIAGMTDRFCKTEHERLSLERT